MFFESAWSRKSIGDVDIVFHDGLYHLFHLVLPNHDFIAHAISDNALNWRRVDNALFIGNPGSWDDLMLWTMHVTADPHHPNRWRMFYTGLSRRDQGRKQRVGLAVSDDLFRWRKVAANWRDLRGPADPDRVKLARAGLRTDIANNIQAPHDPHSCFPLEPDPEYYEASLDDQRNWISFRDPFFFRDGQRGLLLTSARVNHGPLVRRGCVGLLEETTPNQFRSLPPLHVPMLYDDIEVPNLMRLEDNYYLLGSLREDAKIRYWFSSDLSRPWRNHYDNVVLPSGNYAGRICQDPGGMLLWNFYTRDSDSRSDNWLPPPKRLERCPAGRLRARTFEGIEQRITDRIPVQPLRPLKEEREGALCRVGSDGFRIVSEAGFQGFTFDEPVESVHLACRLSLTGEGKCGLLCHIDRASHDGYYFSLDLQKGIAQLRAWSTGAPGTGEHMMQFKTLQEGFWRPGPRPEVAIQLVAFGSYHELSVDGRVILSLADMTFDRGLLGFYVETADLQVSHLVAHRLTPPTQTDEHLANG